MFEPRLAFASLSGEADASWAAAGAGVAGAAFLGGIALDEPSRAAARKLVARDRREFLPRDPFEWIETQLAALDSAPIHAGVNVRSSQVEPVLQAAEICAAHDAMVEINAHCRQAELKAVGCGETLLADTSRLSEYVAAASATDATVSVKVRTEVAGVDLAETGSQIAAAGADIIHVDAMDSEWVVGEIADATELFVIANNEVRDRESVRTYLGYGADAVSVGRPSRNPNGAVLSRVASALAPESTS